MFRTITEFLDFEIKRFEDDPADSSYQRGFLAALRYVRAVVEELVNAEEL